MIPATLWVSRYRLWLGIAFTRKMKGVPSIINARGEYDVFLLPNNSIQQAKLVTKLSIKNAGYTEDVIRDLVAANISSFFPGLKIIATEFSRWEKSGRRLD